VALALLEHTTVYIHIDPRSERVQVPPWFKRQPQLVLQIGLNMPIPIPDLNLDERGISCTLSFNRSPHHCHLPWPSIFALVGEDGRGMVWPDDVPPEVAAQARQQQAEQQRAQLRAVEPAKEAAKPEPAAAPPAGKARRGRRAAAEAKSPASAAPATSATPTPRRKRARKAGASASARASSSQGAAGRAPKPPKLSVVGKEAETRTTAAEQVAAPDAGKKKRELPPYLRIVK
jgi:stringent starvation protein B